METESITKIGHNYADAFTVDKEATCTDVGSQSRHCSRCESTTDITEIASLGHSYSSWTTVEKATCTTDGYKQKECSRCNDIQTQTLKKLDHNWIVSAYVNATCDAEGYDEYTCSRCSETKKENVVEALGHDHYTSVEDPTCLEDGLEKTYCNRCDDYSSTVIPKLGHNYCEIGRLEPTCTADGYIAVSCDKCNDFYEETLDATGHSYSEETISEATCETIGQIKYTCDCGDVQYGRISALGHDKYEYERMDPTTLTNGSIITACTNCEETWTEVIPMIDISEEYTIDMGDGETKTINGFYLDRSYIEELLDLTNEFRGHSDNNLTLADEDSALDSSAKIRALEITQIWEHVRPNGEDASSSFEGDARYVTEIITHTSTPDPQLAFDNWQMSSDHNAAMSDLQFDEVGIACFVHKVDETTVEFYWIQVLR